MPIRDEPTTDHSTRKHPSDSDLPSVHAWVGVSPGRTGHGRILVDSPIEDR